MDKPKYMMVRLESTPAQRANLALLAAKLESLPKGYKHFKMEYYLEVDNLDEESKAFIKYAQENGGLGQWNCPAVACAIGHGPSAGILFKRSEIDGAPMWGRYAQRAFGAREGEVYPLYAWLFSGYWGDVDNHHWGAAARIRYVLHHRQVPSFEDYRQWDDHFWGKYPRYVRAMYREFRITKRIPLLEPA